MDQWPHAWRKIFSPQRAGRIVWTYWELGLDMCGAANPRRREILARMLEGLKDPPGTHAFWPVCVPMSEDEPEQLAANPDMFWSGASAYGARGVVVVGEKAARVLGVAPGQEMHKRFRLCLLDELESYGDEDEEGRKRLNEALRLVEFRMCTILGR
jgi:hypothetical protein